MPCDHENRCISEPINARSPALHMCNTTAQYHTASDGITMFQGQSQLPEQLELCASMEMQILGVYEVLHSGLERLEWISYRAATGTSL